MPKVPTVTDDADTVFGPYLLELGNVLNASTPAGTRTYTYDLGDRITSAGPGPTPAAPTYDDNGNMTSDGSYGGRTYTYDALGRLAGVSGNGVSASYELDGAGNRWAETVNSVTTDFDLDLSAANPTILFDGDRKYMPGAPGAGWEDGGTWYSTVTDLVGSPIKTVTDTGTTSSAIHYDPYGVARPGSTAPAGIGYTGEWRDPTGLINLRARAYDPLLARFIGRDTFGGVLAAPQTANRYSYALGNPFRFTDPSGHFVRSVIEHPGEVISFGIQMTGPGSIYSVFIAITGYDPIAGRSLTDTERQLAAISAIPFIGKPIAHGLGLALEALAKVSGKLVRTLERLDNVFSAIGSKAGAALSRLGRLGEGVTSALRRGAAGALDGSRLSQAGKLRLGGRGEGRILFGQRRVGPVFSSHPKVPDVLRGRTLDDVADDLRAERLSPDDLGIDVFQHGADLVSANSRSLAALSKAGMQPTRLRMIVPDEDLLARLAETPLLPGSSLPHTSIAVTPSEADLSILEVIELP